MVQLVPLVSMTPEPLAHRPVLGSELAELFKGRKMLLKDKRESEREKDQRERERVRKN